MSKLVLCIVVAASLVALVAGHAKLVTPNAFQPNPSTTGPCGGQAALTTSQATWNAGAVTNNAINWYIVAADGEGAIQARLDTTGGTTNFNTPITVTGTTPNAVNQGYSFSVNVPAGTTCTGGTTGDLCTVQIGKSGFNSWIACSTISLQQVAASQAPPAPVIAASTQTITVSTALNFCSMISGSVQIPAGFTSAQDWDDAVSSTYTVYLANPKVFYGANNAGCTTAYKDFLCATSFKKQLTSTVVIDACGSRCEAVRDVCGLNTTHKYLYDCALYTTADADSVGSCPSSESYYGSPAPQPSANGGGVLNGNAERSAVVVYAVAAIVFAALVQLFAF